MLRAVVVDDSSTVRSLLAGILGQDPEIQVVGTAADGEEAVRVVQELHPDVVTMDIQMPRMNGFQATKEIMITSPVPIVIVTASTTVHDVESAMSALRAGALALLMKPPGPEAPEFDESARQLVATVKAMSQVKVVRHHRTAAMRKTGQAAAAARVEVVAIATSTGGPQTLQRLLAELPQDFPAPILVVQHISQGFTAGLATWLGSTVPLRVKVAVADEPLEPSTVYLAPEGRHLGVTPQRTVDLPTDPPIGGFRPSGSYLFESVARAFGVAAVAIILTGMGEDGVEGLRAVRQAGGKIIAQDEASSIVFGMPGAAIRDGLADFVLSPEKIARKLTELTRRA